MSMVVRGMKMPKKCSECLFYVEGASYCQGHRDYETGMETRRMEFCRLIEAPDLQEWQWILLKEVFENVPVITTAARHKENLMEHEIMSTPIGAEAAGVQKQTIEKARTKIIDAAPLMEHLKAAIAFGNEKGLPTDELEQVLADIEGMEALPPAQHGTNLAEVGTDLISRQAAIMDAESWAAVDEYEKHLQKNVVEWLKEFPPAEPEIIECDPVKACNEATMNKLCSAYRYLSMLEDLKVYGYVLAKRRTK